MLVEGTEAEDEEEPEVIGEEPRNWRKKIKKKKTLNVADTFIFANHR